MRLNGSQPPWDKTLKPAKFQPDGLLLIGHGTREAAGVAEFLETARQVAGSLPHILVEPGFLELAEPDIATAFQSLVEQGARRVVAMPLLLLAAGHAKQDIPAAVEQVASRHPTATVCLAEHLGCHQAIVELSFLRFNEALAGPPHISGGPGIGQPTTLVLVGRGSNDPEATAEMHAFARRRIERAPVDRLEVCFAAMAEPSLECVLSGFGDADGSPVVIQPHLLFAGRLLDSIHQQALLWGERYPGRQVLLARQLGPHALLVQAIVDRFAESYKSAGFAT